MGEVMLDVVKLAGKALAGKLPGEELGQSRAPRAVGKSITHQCNAWWAANEIAHLTQPVGAAVLVHSEMVDVGQRDPRLAQAIGDCLRRKSRPVFEPSEAFLFGRGNEYPVAQE